MKMNKKARGSIPGGGQLFHFKRLWLCPFLSNLLNNVLRDAPQKTNI